MAMAKSEAKQVGEFEFVISRVFDAPRDLVWKAWTEPERLDVAHRRAHPERFGFVAGSQHHAAPHDDGAAPQARVISLLDRRVEGVLVRVQDRAFIRHGLMVALPSDIESRH